MDGRNRAAEREEGDDGEEDGVKTGKVTPIPSIYSNGQTILAIEIFSPKNVANIQATTWRKDVNGLTSVTTAQSSRYPRTKKSATLRLNHSTIA